GFRRDLTAHGPPRQEKRQTRPMLLDLASNGNGVRGVRRSGAGSRDLLIDPCRPSRQGSINRSVVYALAEQFVLLLLELLGGDDAALLQRRQALQLRENVHVPR